MKIIYNPVTERYYHIRTKDCKDWNKWSIVKLATNEEIKKPLWQK
jgi:hypothetical protein